MPHLYMAFAWQPSPLSSMAVQFFGGGNRIAIFSELITTKCDYKIIIIIIYCCNTVAGTTLIQILANHNRGL